MIKDIGSDNIRRENMTLQEAIERLRCMRLFMEINDKDNESKFLEEDYEANSMAISALEKQIPMEVIEDGYDEDDDLRCPICEAYVGSNEDGLYGAKYCSKCGQRIVTHW